MDRNNAKDRTDAKDRNDLVAAGNQLRSEAEDELRVKSCDCFIPWFDKSNDVSKALKLYEKACTKYKLGKRYDLAIDVLEDMLVICVGSERKRLITEDIIAYCVKTGNKLKKISYTEQLAKSHVDDGSFFKAGKLHESLGDYFRHGDFPRSIDEYDSAIEYLSCDLGNGRSICEIKIKKIECLIIIDRYEESVAELDELFSGKEIEKSLLQPRWKDIFLLKGMCFGMLRDIPSLTDMVYLMPEHIVNTDEYDIIKSIYTFVMYKDRETLESILQKMVPSWKVEVLSRILDQKNGQHPTHVDDFS